MAADHGVAFARRGFELSAAEDAQAAIPAEDELGFLQAMEQDGHGRTGDAGHHGEKLVLQRKIVCLDAVVHLQQRCLTSCRALHALTCRAAGVDETGGPITR